MKKSLILFSLFLLSLPTVFPQRRGGGQGQGSGLGQGQGQKQGLGQGQGQGGMQTGSAQAERKRIHTTTQQRDQIRSCDKLADGIRKQARTMAKSSGSKFNPDEAIRQQSQIRDQIKAMEQEHERLMGGLDANQQTAWQEQIRNMNQSRQQINLQQEHMEGALKNNPDPKRVAERAKEMEKTMQDWRNQYAVLSSQIEP